MGRGLVDGRGRDGSGCMARCGRPQYAKAGIFTEAVERLE